MILFCKSSREASLVLDNSFSSQSLARSMQIRTQLGAVKKLGDSITVYFNKVKSMSDILASIGQALRPEESMTYLLDGLDEEYDSLVESVLSRATPLSIHELYARLLLTEQRIERRHAVDINVYSAHLARAGSRNFSLSSRSRNRPKSGASSLSAHNISVNGSEEKSGRIHTSRPICQLCEEIGHKASCCFKRFQRDFLGVEHDERFMSRHTSVANHIHQGHTSPHSGDTQWYLDTGATDHIANSTEQMNSKEEYHGYDQVHAANGQGMKITHIGRATLSTHSPKQLHLRFFVFLM